MLHAHCAEIGRDPAEIEISAHVWLKDGTPDAIADTVQQIAALAEHGLELAIIYLLPPLRPDVLAPLARALEPLR